jgi:hypothetical protein
MSTVSPKVLNVAVPFAQQAFWIVPISEEAPANAAKVKIQDTNDMKKAESIMYDLAQKKIQAENLACKTQAA